MELRGAGRLSALALLMLAGAAWWLAPGMASGTRLLGRHYLMTQDCWLVAVLIAAWWRLGGGGRMPAVRAGPTAAAVATALLVGGWVGARVVMARYDLSRDEQMVTFDSAIDASGRVFQVFPPAWRGFWDAVNQTFILPIGNREAWVSAYLPVNAALRALFGVFDATLAGPAYAAVGALALWRIGARLWPAEREVQVAVLLLYAGSSQLWITAMTGYAMNAHLALNLVWLWLFLGDRPWRHAAALVIGFLATGLHQPIFHPLFVLPFLNLLLQERRWRVLAVYVAGYGAIGLFWLAWPLWLSAQAATLPLAAASPEGIGYLERLARANIGIRTEGIGLMAANLVRFAAWQHLLLLPLMVVGIAAGWRTVGIVRALALGLVLPVAVLLVILPDQGLGWGYRYLHGLIGSACLLGGYGWQALGSAAPRRAMLAATIASIALVIPLHAVMAQRFVAPFAAARAAAIASKADFVLVDDAAAPFVQDLVINRADLTNRPLLLKASALSAAQLGVLCARGSVAFLGHDQLQAIAARFGLTAADHTAQLRAAAAAAGCVVKPAG